MIKRPYNKQGEIQYVEITKIFLFVSFFIGLFSQVTAQSGHVSGTGLIVFSVLVIIMVLIASVQEMKELLALIKGYIITWIHISIPRPTNSQITVHKPYVLIVTSPTIYSLNVIRC